MKEMLKRSFRTFIQAALGYLAANLVYIVSASPEGIDYWGNAVMGLCISAIAAGLSAVMNIPHKEKCDCNEEIPSTEAGTEPATAEAAQSSDSGSDGNDTALGKKTVE